MFGIHKKTAAPPFDTAGKRPVIRCSICTGEQVAGFRDIDGGRFHEVMLIRTDADLREFLKMFSLEEKEVAKEY